MCRNRIDCHRNFSCWLHKIRPLSARRTNTTAKIPQLPQYFTIFKYRFLCSTAPFRPPHSHRFRSRLMWLPSYAIFLSFSHLSPSLFASDSAHLRALHKFRQHANKASATKLFDCLNFHRTNGKVTQQHRHNIFDRHCASCARSYPKPMLPSECCFCFEWQQVSRSQSYISI